MEIPDTGSHLVNKTKEFRLRNSKILYIRTADRFIKFLKSALKFATFGLADRLWRSLQQKMTDFVNNYKGKATILNPTIHRLDWNSKIKQHDIINF
jgi:hypothetical protein